ncbi:TagK domain-containing protein [Glaciimonas soli]|nr:TagK domain-containing protein [Glaciimonas soli]
MKPNLSLCVLHQHGVQSTQQKVITFSEDAQLSTIKLKAGLPTAEYAWLDLVQCTLSWQAEDAAWALQHGYDGFNCTINDLLLAIGESALLHVGDCIEIGMLRLQVLAAQEQHQPVTSTDMNSTLHDDAHVVGHAEKKPFALTDLADKDYWKQGDEKNNPYDIVPTITLPDYALNNERYRASEVKQNSLAQLGKNYIKAIVDPAALHGQQVASMQLTMLETKLLTPEQRAASLREQDTLSDILSGPVDGANYYLDKFAPAKEFAGELALSKHDAMQRYTWDLNHNNSRTRPPELTRREHHAMSPDSHFSLERAFPEIADDTNDANKK